MDILKSALHSFVTAPKTFHANYLLEGPPCVGKTRLVVELLNAAVKEIPELKLVVGIGSASHIASPYYVIGQVLEQMMDLNIHKDLYVGKDHASIIGASVSTSNPNVRLSTIDLLPNSPFVAPILKWIHTHTRPGTVLEESLIQQIREETAATENGRPSTAMRGGRWVDVNRRIAIVKQGSSKDDIEGREESNGYALVDLVPLLEPVLSIHIKQNAVTYAIDPKEKRIVAEAFVLKLLLIGMEIEPTVVYVDSVQWVDRASLKLLTKFIGMVNLGMVVLTVRASNSRKAPALKDDAGSPVKRARPSMSTIRTPRRSFTDDVINSYLVSISSQSTIVKLKSLDDAEIRELIEKVVGSTLLRNRSSVLSADNVRQMREKSGGNPAYMVSLSTGIKNAIVRGNYHGVQDLPTNAQNLVVRKFDELPNDCQAVLKTATIVGYVFDTSVLKSVLKELEFVDAAESLRQP